VGALMAWILHRAYRDNERRLIVVVAAPEVFASGGVRIGWGRAREFTWSLDDPRLYDGQGALRSKRVIIDGIKAEIRTTLQAEAQAPPPAAIEDYPGTGETI
jgi:hypothetical protein